METKLPPCIGRDITPLFKSVAVVPTTGQQETHFHGDLIAVDDDYPAARTCHAPVDSRRYCEVMTVGVGRASWPLWGRLTLAGLLVVAGAVWSAVGMGWFAQLRSSSATPAAAKIAPYPVNAQTNYLNACETGGGSVTSCGCQLSYLEQHISFTQVLADEDQLRTGTSPLALPDIAAAAKHCGA